MDVMRERADFFRTCGENATIATDATTNITIAITTTTKYQVPPGVSELSTNTTTPPLPTQEFFQDIDSFVSRQLRSPGGSSVTTVQPA